MKNTKIKISDNGTVHVPRNVRMNITEIAELFQIFYQAAKKNIRSIEKLGICTGDQSMSGTVEGAKIVSDYYGLDMIIAIAFRVQSVKANIFRKWIIDQSTKPEVTTMPLLSIQNAMLN
ncbi:virulence RhuM family protein [Dysgonomonas sp. BGC7]|uniref:virulence RhuM family protein n=1 Tax=Dysgonomonas sp. BGC7 TaxID=1658008 RepID=UPI0006836441|nr:virulence RhuM family protein [Dysgonomonas sp. BGC7]MBD8389182.1 virulence RhuM family protein [Dysgonomonas sp. BGC7]